MNNIISQFKFTDILHSTFDAKNTFQGESEWRQVFDKLMMGVFTRDENRNSANSNHLVQDKGMEMTNYTANKEDAAYNPVEIRTPQANGLHVGMSKDVTFDDGRSYLGMLDSKQTNSFFAVTPAQQDTNLVNGKETVDISSDYCWEMLRKKLLNKKMDRIHIVLAENGIKIYMRNFHNSDESVSGILNSVLSEISHKDYAITEIKINGITL